MDFIQKFKTFLLLQKPIPSPATVKNYVVDVKHFIAWYESFLSRSFNPDEVTAATIVEFKRQKSSSYSIRSIERHISSLKKFFHALKMQGIISDSPFDVLSEANKHVNSDPWHLKEFKDYLYVYNASRLTIKNYIIDVKQFLHWIEQVSQAKEATKISERNIFGMISNPILEEYKTRLAQEGSFSASSINRKLSSLRKYLNWANQQGLLQTQIAIPDNLNNIQKDASTLEFEVPEKDINIYPNKSSEGEGMAQDGDRTEQSEGGLLLDKGGSQKVAAVNEVSDALFGTVERQDPKKEYSSFPPFRLVQKIGKGLDVAIEAALIAPLTKGVILAQKQLWKVQGKKLFVNQSAARGRLPIPSFIPHVSNIKKAIYAPHALSTKYFPWYRKAIYHARYTRPGWYRRYHQMALAHYFNWAVLIVFCTAIGFGMYNSFVAKPKEAPTLAATAPPRILSFQGRLTDSADTPITASTNLRFAIYSDPTSSGSALLWQEVDGVIPDKNGVFSVLLGKGTTIPQSLFANNQSLYLGITVGNTPELTPRQQLATVAYAANSETLQGMPPITQSGAGTQNVILALDSSGNLSIGASTTFQSTSGSFTLAGNTVAFTTNSGSNGNITFAPDGTGLIDLQKPLVNTSVNNNIIPGLSAVEVDDLFAVLATSAASATIINQNGTGALLTASSAGVTKFTVGNLGDITSSNYTVNGGVLYTDGTGLFLQTPVGSLGECLTSNGGGAPSWAACGSGTNFWTLDANNGVLYPINTTVDIFFGGTSSTSANFAFINNAAGTPTASISGNLTLNSTGKIQTTNNQSLTIGGSTTGNIILSPLNGLGNVTIAGLTAGIVHSNNSGVLTSSALNLAGGATEVSGVLPLANGGTNNSLTPNNGGIVYSDASKLQILAASATVGQCLLSGGSGSPSWGNCTVGGGNNWWNMNLGTLFPVNTTLDLVLGGTGTSSAKFAVLNIANSTPTASVSSGLNGSGIYIAANGVIQTTNNQGLTLGGTTTGNIILSPLNGTGTVTINGKINSSLTPAISDTYDLGSSSLEWNNIYVKNLITTGNISGFFQRNLGVISPTNITDDFAVGGTATSSAKFQIFGNTGNATTAGTLTFDGGGNLIQTTRNQGLTIGGNTTGNITLSPLNGNGTVTINGTIASSLVPSANNTFDLGSPTLEWRNIFASGNFAGFWQRFLGVLSPTNSTDDLAVGGTSTSSAKFQIFGNTGNATTAGNLTFNGNGQIQTTNNSALTLGGSTTGNIIISPLNGSGNVTITGLGTGVVQSNSGVLSVAAVDLGTEVTGILPIANGGTNANSLGSAGAVAYSSGTAYAFTGVGSAGQCLVSNGSLAPFWSSCSAAAGANNYWTLDTGLGTLYPINSTLDVFFGGTSTSSANFAFINNAAGTPTASISGNLTLNSAGVIQTTKNQPLTIGGNTTGSITLAPSNGQGILSLNSPTILTNQTSVNLFNTTATSINFGGAADINLSTAGKTTTINGGLTVAETSNLNGNVNLGNATGDQINVTGRFISSLIPNATDTFDLGTSSLEWNNLYVRNIISGGNFSGFWQRFLGVLSPTNITDDLAVGGTSTSSAKFQIFGNTGNATTAGNLTFNGNGQIQTTNNTALTLGGSTTGNIILSPLNGTGSVTVNGSQLTTTASSFDLLNTTATTINFGGAVTTANLVTSATTLHLADGAVTNSVSIGGTAGGTTTINNALAVTGTTSLNGNVNLGDTTGDLINVAGRFTSSLIPNQTDTYDLGSSSLEWNNLFVKNIISAGNISGFWQRFLGVLSPTNSTDDLVVGGTSTSSAKFQIFGNTGNATTAGNLTFNGNGQVQTTNNSPLTLGGSTTGNIILSPNNGTGSITINGTFNSSLIPTTTNTYDLGSPTAGWNNLYVNNIISSGSISGFWQRQLGVLSPANVSDDLALGGTSTSSALFQVFGNTGNATTAGNLTFSGNGVIQTTNNQPLTLGGNSTGNIILSPNNGTGSLTINGTVNSDLNPTTTDTYNLGSAALEWNNLYVRNIISAGNISGFWQRFLGVVSPTNISDDLAVGGTSTSSALFQIFGNTGNATTAGNLTFNGNGVIQTTNNTALTLGGSTTGNITLSPLNGNGTVTINGNKLLTTASSFDLLNTTATTINFGGAADINLSTAGKTTTVNGALTVAGTSNLNGNVNLGDTSGDTLMANGEFGTDLIPNADGSFNLGSPSLEWNNAYVKNLVVGGSILGFFQKNNSVIAPLNISDDLAIGGASTSSAKFQIFGVTGNATTTGTLTFNATGNLIQTTRNQGLTIGGNTTGNITLSPLNGNGTVTIDGNKLVTTASSFDLLNATATTINFGGAADVNLSTAGKTTTVNGDLTVDGTSNLNGNINLGNANTDLINPAGVFSGSLIPQSTSVNLGSSTNNFGSVFAQNYFASGNFAGFWQRFLGVLSPTNSTDDLVVGGTSTSSAKFQIFGNTGNATTAGNLTFNGNGQIQTTNNTPLTLGGDATGNIILKPNNGSGSVTVNGTVNSDLTPTTTDTYNLGTPSLEWNNLYVKNIISGGSIAGFWQRFNNIISPANISDDLALGGTSTSSAKFQVFGVTGNATTAGNLTFNGNGVIQTTNNQPLTLGGNTTGAINLSANNGSGAINLGANLITISGNNPSISTVSNNALSLLAGTGTITLGTNTTGGDIQFFNSSTKITNGGALTTAGTITVNGTGSSFIAGTLGIGVSPLTAVGLDVEKDSLGNTLSLFKQLSSASSADIITASNSAGLTQFTLTNTGVIQARSFQDLDNTSYLLDPASTNKALLIAGTEGVGTTNPLLLSGIDIEKDSLGNAALVVANLNTAGDLLTASNSAGTKFTIQNDGTIKDAKYTTDKGIIYADSNGIFGQTAQGASHTVLHGNGTSAPSFSAVDLTLDVTGVLPLSNGGTNNNLTADNGGIVYSDSSKLQILAHSATIGQCLLSGGSGAPTWGNCTTGGGTNWWNVNLGTLYPVNSTLDLLLGGTSTDSAKFAVINMTGSGTPTASVSSGLNGNATFITADGTVQTSRNQGLTLGGSTTGNITLSPLNGNGTVTINGNKLLTTASSFDLLNTTATTINFGGAATTANIATAATTLHIADSAISNTLSIGGTAGGTTTINNALAVTGNTNLNGNVTLGDANTDLINPAGVFSGSLIPQSTTINLGSATNYFGSAYITNLFPATGSNYEGFFQRFNGVLSPTNITDDLSIGGTSTSSAKFQIFGNTGNATTAGNLTFNSNGQIQTTNNQPLTLGGNSTGNIILSPNNGTGNITINGKFNSSLIPSANNTYDLGQDPSIGNEWNNIYANNIYANGQPLTQIWQRNAGVLSPLNITDDVAVGGTSTSSAKFQIFGLTGNATSTGTLTFTSGGSQIQTTSNQTLTLGGTTTGGITLSPSNGTGIVTFNSPTLATTQTSLNVFNTTATTINFGGAADINLSTAGKTTTVNGALTVAGTSNLNGNVNLGDANTDLINPAGVFSGSLIPQSTSINLGSATNNFGSVYAQNLFLSGNYGGFFQRFNGAISPANITDDFLIGGTATSTAKFQIFGNTGNATTAGNLTFNGNGQIQTTNNTPLTLGGSTTGNIILKPNNGSGSVTVNGTFNSNLIPTATNTYDLGSLSLQWNNLYANNIYANGQPLTQLFQRNQGVLSPLNITDDLAIGNTATSTAKFQIFGLTGNATTTGSLTFTGGSTNNIIATRNNQGLSIGDSQTGNITITALNGGAGSTIALNAATITTNQTSLNLFNTTPTTINFGGAADINLSTSGKTTTVNGAFTVAGTSNLNGNVNLGDATGDQINVTGRFISSLIPNANNTYDLGSNVGPLQWNNIYGHNFYQDGSPIIASWQRNLGVLSPLNITDDVTVGGTATSSAKFQIFGLTGNATTAGTLTFNGSGNLIQTTNNQPLTIGGNTTGGITLSPSNGAGTVSLAAATVALTGTTPTVTTVSNNALSILAGTGTITLGTNSTGGDIQFFSSSNKITNAGNLTIAGTATVNGTGASFIAGRLGIGVSPTIATALDVEKDSLGNAAAIFANLNTAGDLITASNSAATQFVVTNSGVVKARSFQDLDNTSYLLDPASTSNSLLVAGSVGIGTTNPLLLSGLDIEKNAQGNAALIVANLNTAGDLFTASNSAATKFTIQNDGTIKDAKYTTGGGILFGTSTGVFTQTAAGNLGQCLTSTAGGTPVWQDCASGSGVSSWWTMSNGSLYPVNSTLDLFVGGSATTSAKFAVLNMTGSGTPTASVSSGLNGNSTFITADGSLQTTRFANLTLGGTTTGDITLTPHSGVGSVIVNSPTLDSTASTFNLFASVNTTLNIGATSGTTNFKAPVVDDSQASLTLFSTPTTINFGGAATTLNIGKSGGTTTVLGAFTVNGNTTLGTNTSNTVVVNGLISGAGANNALQPAGNGTTDLGSATHYWATVYANNFISPVSGGTAGFWQLTSNVISPVNAWNDLAIGGNATSSATPWQVFATTVGVNTAGTATSSGGLSFRGTTTNVNLLNGSILKVNTSVGGDEGLTGNTKLELDNNGDLTLGGANIITTQSTLNLFNSTATTINFGGGATSAINIGNASGTTTLRGNLVLGSSATNTIFPNGKFSSDIIPTSASINLGSATNNFGNAYITNLYISGNISGFWQRFTNVISPFDIANDLAIGGTSTSSAKFQIFGTSGNATTTGTLTFNSSSNAIIQTSNMFPLVLGSATTGSVQISPKGTTGLFVAGTGLVGVGTNVPGFSLAVTGNDSSANNNLGTIALSNTAAGGGNWYIRAGATGTNTPAGGLSIANDANYYLNFSSIGKAGFGTLLTGNGQLVVNQTNTSGLGDIFSASTSGIAKFTIANDGTIKNSLIPFATDTYNLGSDPSLPGGKEWDTLYVRQIVTPANGGLAGFWQLSNAGVLAPANTTNDLVIGGNSTASAHFQVFGSGSGVGTIAATLNDPKVNNNAGTFLASTKIINVSSPDHTYMTLTNQDLTIGGHKNLQSISNVKRVFIYDTTKDSDGGRWTNDERAQASSWYNETRTDASSCTIDSAPNSKRCGQQAFPRKAIIVVAGQHTYIFDAKDNSLWMEFDKFSGSGTDWMIGQTTNSTGSSVTALNGKIYFGNAGTFGGVYVVDFIHDTSYKYDNNGYSTGNLTIANRNSGENYVTVPNISIKLPTPNTNDLSVNIINGKTYLAVATRGDGTAGTGGSVALINESNMSMAGRYGSVLTVGAIANNVWLTSRGDLYAVICVDSSNPCANFVLKVKHNAQNGTGTAFQTFDEVYGYLSSGAGKYGVTTTDNGTTSSITTMVPGPVASTAAQLNAQGLYVTEGTSTVDGISNTVYLAEGGSGGAMAILQENQASPAAGMVKYYNSNYITEDMVGDIRGMWPLTESSGNFSDATYLGDTLTASASGVTYSASGVRGTGVTLNGTGFLSCQHTNCGGPSRLDPNRTTFSIGIWFKNINNAALMSKFNTGAGVQTGSWFLGATSGHIQFQSNSPTTITQSTKQVTGDSNWHFAVVTLDGTWQKIYIDGILDGQSARSAALPAATADFLVGALYSGGTPANILSGTIDEPFVSASALTPAEIWHMYQVGEKALQNHSSKTIRGVVTGSDSNQKLINGNSNVSAVAANMQNGQIYIGTQGGGTSVVGMDSDTVTDMYSSAVNTTDDAGNAWSASANNNFVTSIAAAQSYGNGMALVLGTNNNTSGGAWIETQDTNLKDWMATSYNPFGSSLTQSNLVVDNVFRVTNQISTRLDNFAATATSSASLDLFQIDNSGAILSNTNKSNPNYITFQDQNANTLLNIDTVGGDTDTMLSLLQPGTGDVLIASSSAGTRMQLTNAGILRTTSFQDLDDTRYFLDPAAGTTSLTVAGSVGIGTFSPSQNLHIFSNSNASIGIRIENTNTGSSAFAQLELKNSAQQFNLGLGSSGTASFPNSFFIYDTQANTPRFIISQPGFAGFGAANSAAIGNAALVVNQKNQSGLGDIFSASVSGSTKFVIDNSGFVGIGTNNPATLVDLVGGSSDELRIMNLNGATPKIHFRNNTSTNDNFIGQNTGGNLSVYSDNGTTEALTVLSSNTVGVGINNNNPQTTLDILGSSALTPATATTYALGVGNSAVRDLTLGSDSSYAYLQSWNSKKLKINAQGNGTIINADVVIGAADPTSGINLDIDNTHTNNWIRLQNNGNTSDNWMIGNEAGNSKLFFVGRASGASNIYTKYVAFNTTGSVTISGGFQGNTAPDYAEWIPVNDMSIEPGDVLSADTTTTEQAKRSDSPYQYNVMGIVSTNPSFSAGGKVNADLDQVNGPNERQIALVGRVPTKVSTENGPIHIGDPLTTSSVPGVAMKATKAGPIVGKALEAFDGSTATQAARLVGGSWQITNGNCQTGEQDCYSYQKTLVFVNVSWYNPDSFLTSLDGISTTVQNGIATVTNALGKTVSQIGVFASAVVGNLQTGIINSQQIFTNSLAVATSNITIAGQSLHDYVAGIVSEVLQNNQQGFSSPIASIDQLQTNLISPLASGSAVALSLDNSGISVKNTISQNTVARIDNSGNATFSGQLASQNLAVNSDATVSGTLHAHRIEADEIAGLSAAVGTLSAQNITNVTNIYFATPSANTIASGNNIGSNGISSSSSGALTPFLGYASIASYSGFLSYVPNLNSDTAFFTQNLTSLGQTSLSDTTINGQLAIGTQLILAENTINVLGGTFQIQSLRQGDVTFEGGLIAIDTDGNLTVNGNAVFTKNLAANVISPLSNDRDLTFKLGENSQATGSALATSTLSVQNASGSGIFNVDQLGNLIASGAASVGKLNLNAVQPVLAVSDTEVIATGSAGTAKVKAHQLEVTIDNKLVTPKSLIYITPVGQTTYSPYLLRQVSGTSFTVGIPVDQFTDTTFNWLIVN